MSSIFLIRSVYETGKFLSHESLLRPESHGYCKNEMMSYSPCPQSSPVDCQIISAENRKFRRAQSSPDVTLQTKSDESYSFQCSRPGLYQCRVTGLLFHMEGEGDVVYRIVPWNRRRLAQYHKKPAGPLFDIRCVQQSVCRLHLPHCEISSTGGCQFLSVAHVKEESMEFISPHEITETHVIINITGFSGFGNVKDEDSPPVPVRALVLLFYRPSPDPDVESVINVLLVTAVCTIKFKWTSQQN
uniref:FIIND domain-containing protein n=1 Tax=Seriola dumerili TaxID=41447 RepID=A0A3B4TJP0_SERDU